MFSSFVYALGVGALSEIGDKSQFLLFLLAFRCRSRPALVVGMVAATVLSHIVAGLTAVAITTLVDPETLRWGIAALFVALALWAMSPRLTENLPLIAAGGTFLTVLASFFLVEVGDKSNLTAGALFAEAGLVLPVLTGATLGMLLVNLPIGLWGPRLAEALIARGVTLERLGRAVAVLFAVAAVYVAISG